MAKGQHGYVSESDLTLSSGSVTYEQLNWVTTYSFKSLSSSVNRG